MVWSLFFQVFSIMFLSLFAVGPIFLLVSNITMTRGYKAGFFAIAGCLTVDLFYMPLGALTARILVSALPENLEIFLSILATIFLLNIAYSFWKSDISKMHKENINTKDKLKIYFKLLFLTGSSPSTILSYGIIFASLIDARQSVISAILGGYTGTLTFHILMLTIFGTIGKKINIKILSIFNKGAALFVGIFSILILIKAVKFFL